MNKKGFTLIELIVVIAIMAIIALISTPIINNVITQSKERTYKEQLNAIINSAKNYMTTHTNELPTTAGSSKCLTVEDLKTAGVLKNDTIKNPVGANYKDYIETDSEFNGGVLIKYNGVKYKYSYVNDCSEGTLNGYVYTININTITINTEHYHHFTEFDIFLNICII